MTSIFCVTSDRAGFEEKSVARYRSFCQYMVKVTMRQIEEHAPNDAMRSVVSFCSPLCSTSGAGYLHA
jgi:hypothetical protein